MRPKAIPILLLAFFGCLSSPAHAQVNLKTGYNFSIPSTGGMDQLIFDLNSLRSYSDPFTAIKWMHGFEAGLRMKGGPHAIELTYQGAYQSSKATGQNGDENYTDKIRVYIHSGSIGYQVSEGSFGAGADLQYQYYRTKFTDELNDSQFKYGQKILAMKFYFMITLKGSKGVDMALQPYYVLPFKEFDLEPLAQYLQVENSGNDKWRRFGLSVLFYNGRK